MVVLLSIPVSAPSSCSSSNFDSDIEEVDVARAADVAVVKGTGVLECCDACDSKANIVR